MSLLVIRVEILTYERLKHAGRSVTAVVAAIRKLADDPESRPWADAFEVVHAWNADQQIACEAFVQTAIKLRREMDPIALEAHFASREVMLEQRKRRPNPDWETLTPYQLLDANQIPAWLWPDYTFDKRDCAGGAFTHVRSERP